MTIPLFTTPVPSTADPVNFSARADILISELNPFIAAFNADIAALNTLSTTDTSDTSNTVGTGSKTFTVTAGKSFFVGMSLTIANTAAPTNRMFAVVTSYSGTTLQVTSQAFEGSGTYASWSIALAFNGVIGTSQIQVDAITSALLADSALGGALINGYINVPAPSGNALTINIKTKAGADPSATDPVLVVFRNSSLTTSGYVVRSITAATSITVSSGSTLGSVNAISSRIIVLLLDNAGTVELAVSNLSGGLQLDETNLISTTAEGGAGAADSATVVYSTTARSNLAYRVAGFFDSTQATAGTYVTAPSLIQNCFGQALAALSSLGYGQTWQAVTRLSGTTYYNTTGKPIYVAPYVVQTAQNGISNVSISVNGSVCCQYQLCGSGAGGSNGNTGVVVPINASYSINLTAGSGAAIISTTYELR